MSRSMPSWLPGSFQNFIWQDPNFGSHMSAFNPATGKQEMLVEGSDDVGTPFAGDNPGWSAVNIGFQSQYPNYAPAGGPTVDDGGGGFMGFLQEAAPVIALAAAGGLGAFSGFGGAAAGGADIAGGFAGDILGSTGGADLLGTTLTGSIPGGASNMSSLWQAAQGGGSATGGSLMPPAVLETGGAPFVNTGALGTSGGTLFTPTGVNESVLGLGGAAGGFPSLPSVPTGGSGNAGAGGTAGALSRILDGSATNADWLSVLGTAGATGLGIYGANQQSGALSDLARQYQEYGAPSRGRFEASMTPGFDPTSIPGYSGALKTSADQILAGLSAQNGNPFGNPGGLIDANKKIVAGTALPAINEYQRLNANTGFGNSMNAALGLQTQGIGADANTLNALGFGLNALTNKQPSLAELLRLANGQSF